VATGALDVRADVLRATLYPSDGVNPNSSSPIGARHTKYAERLAHILPSVDAHETIERAWALYRRRQRDARERALSAKFDAMADACAELESVSVGEHKALYDRAMVRMAHGAAANVAAAQGVAQGRKKTPESRWKEARPEGLVPREAWVPTETRGKGWNYEWTRPEN
jgi:large subunit ribosomal protein L40